MKVAVGQAFSVEGREAVSHAVYDALLNVESAPVGLALLIASAEYDMQEILNGAINQLGSVPVLGFSTSGEITSEGYHRRSVVAALFAGEGLEARGEWLPGFGDESARVAKQMVELLELDRADGGALFVVADGHAGDYEALAANLPVGNFQFAGCLAGGDLRLGRTYQIGGTKAGAGGLAAAYIKQDKLRVGIGVGHGWKPVGANFRITRSRGPWVRALDGKPATDAYAALFGQRSRAWSFPPLNTLVRLYPLGIEQDGAQELQVRTPLRVEADGSLRMTAEIRDGSIGHLLVGTTQQCLDAARKAAGQAQKNLKEATPKLALVLADVSWEMLFKSQPGAEVEAVREVLGRSVPIIGGYTFGQLVHHSGAPRPEFLNQHIQVILVGEET